MRSYLDTKDKSNSTIRLINKNTAFKNVRNNLYIKYPPSCSPIARKVSPDSVNTDPPNVILIIMEGMSTAKMSYHGNPKNLTPFLDSLSTKSYYFENIYTAGKHTFNGVFWNAYFIPGHIPSTSSQKYHEVPWTWNKPTQQWIFNHLFYYPRWII